MEEENFTEKKFYKQKNFWLGVGAALVLFLVLTVGVKIFDSNVLESNFSSVFKETLGDVFGFTKEKPIYEIDLATGEGRDLKEDEDFLSLSAKKDGDNKGKGVASTQSLILPSAKLKSNVTQSADEKKKSVSEVLSKKGSSSLEVAKEEKPKEVQAKECDFSTVGNPDGRIYFNEIAWMGGLTSASDEWIELKNNSSGEINLAGWQIKNQSEKIKVVFDAEVKILANGFLLFERTDDNSVSNVPADKIYSGAMSNESEWLKFFDADCNLVDEVNASWGWGKFGGDNSAKKTLERNLGDAAWHTANATGGTPRAKNSEPVLVEGNPPSDKEEENDGSGGSSSSSTPANPPAPQNPAAMKVLISEVMAGSSASVDDEFIEIYNYGTDPADLTGWTIKKKTSSGAEPSPLVVASRLEGKVIPAGKYFLLAHDGGYAGAVAADVLWPSSYSLAYTNNSITIYNASGAVIDQVSWVEIPKDKSYARSSMDISAGFGVSESPNPQNSQ